jgi:hypothetical protein
MTNPTIRRASPEYTLGPSPCHAKPSPDPPPKPPIAQPA